MQAYLGGQNVVLTIPLVDSAGVAIVASGVQYRVIDQNEQELIAKVTLIGYVAAAPNAVVTVLGTDNALGTATRALRVVELHVTSASGVTVISTEYLIEATSVLVISTNTFQTYSAAVLVGYEMPSLPAWNDATKKDRISALISAFRNFSRLRLRYINYDGTMDQSRLVVAPDFACFDITMMDQSQFIALPVEYRNAICRAQIFEAEFLLGGEEIEDIRKSGIMSATVGESSQFFRASKPYEGAVCKRAMKELHRYIITNKSVGRV